MFKKIIPAVVILLLLICAFLPLGGLITSREDFLFKTPFQGQTASRATLLVGSGQTYTTITDAVAAASSGDTIIVTAGTYYEEVVLDKTLTLTGAGQDISIVDSSGSNVPLEITADWCNVTGFTFTNSSNGATDGGVLINSKFNHVADSNCSDNAGNGVRIEALGANNTVSNCLITGNGRNGLRIQAAPYNTIIGCTVYGNQENGIFLQNTDGNVIENNTVRESLTTGKSCIAVSSVNNNVFKYNSLTGNDHGLAIAMGDNGVLAYNTIFNTSDYAISLGGASDNNLIHHNNFIECNKSGSQAADGGTGNFWDNGYPSGGNYWSDWVVPDTMSGAAQDQAGPDGFVDSPYLVDGSASASDGYPLTTPFVLLKITTTDVTSTFEDDLYDVTYQAYTNLPASVSWSLKTNAGFLSLVGSRLYGTPVNDDVGSYWVDITASTGQYTDNHNFTLNVLNVNDPPVITTADVNVSYEDVLYSVDYDATDIDPTGDTFDWTLSTDAGFLAIDGATGVLSGTPLQADIGSYFVNVTVGDGRGGFDNSNFTLMVLNVNDPPELNGTWDPVEFDEDTIDESLDLTDMFIDIDGDVLAYNHSGAEKIGVKILSGGAVRFTPEANWSGMEVVTFYSSDASVEVNSTLNVTVLPVNDAPFGAAITVLTPGNLTAGGNQSAKGAASDVDLPYGDALTYNWSSNISGFIALGETVDLGLSAGTHLVTLNVTDSAGAWTIATKQVFILPAADPGDDDVADDDVADDDVVDDDVVDDDTDDDVVDPPDTDNDTLPDPWEEEHWGHLNQSDADDPDGDGFNNRQEYDNGTDPNDPNSYPGAPAADDDDDDDDDGTGNAFVKYWYLWLLLLLLLIIVVIIIILALRKKKDEEEHDLHCPECGEDVGMGMEECPYCGSELPTEAGDGLDEDLVDEDDLDEEDLDEDDLDEDDLDEEGLDEDDLDEDDPDEDDPDEDDPDEDDPDEDDPDEDEME